MSIPAQVEKAFAEVLSRHFAAVWRGAEFGGVGDELADGDAFPVVCECEEAAANTRSAYRAWTATVRVEVWTPRDVPIDAADAAADLVFERVADAEAEIEAEGRANGLQFGRLRVEGQGLRTEENARAISTSYGLTVAKALDNQ